MTLTTTILNTIKDIEALRIAQIKRHEAIADQLEATRDVDGRYHAPSGGTYYEGTFYIGGQYLPMDDSMGFKRMNGKVQIEANDIEEIREACKKYADIETGKSWQRNGTTYCYAYFCGIQPQKVVNAISNFYTKKEESKPQKVVGQSPVGKVEVEGVILGFKEVISHYGISLKMLVELDNGSKVFGTAPKGQYGQGDKILFKANFQEQEHGFSFFKRPKFIRVV